MSQLRKLFILLLLLIPTSAFAVTAGVEDAKSIARLYSAAFNRNPDISGLNFWVYSYEAGRPLLGIAGDFYKSPEFTSRYGTLSDLQYVELLYRNVLGRPGEKAGVNFWKDHLANGVSRAKILTEFADSPENVAKTADIFANMHIMNCQWLFGSAQPVNDNTGCLVGPAVSGLAYETQTHQGVTGPRGDFQYEKGETVRFMLGDTLLGEVLAQAQLTPFDLASTAVVTGLNIEWALESLTWARLPVSRSEVQAGQPMPNGSIYIDELVTPEYGPFLTLVNMVVFLQSLDADADPTNGIEIRSEVAALFNGVNLNLKQEWQTFLSEPALRHAIWRANNEHRFSKAHRIINPAPALKHLYQSLGVNARTVAVSRQWDMLSADQYPSLRYQYDADGNRTHVKTLRPDGTVDEVLTRRYDAEGNVIRQSIDNNGDGFRDEVVVRKYDQNGNPPQIEWDQNADGVTDYVEYWLYDSVGNATLVSEGRAEFPLATFEGRSIAREIYTSGNRSRIEFDRDDDGIIDSTDTFEYDQRGHLIRFEGGWPPEVSVWNYDAGGNLTRYVKSSVSHVANTLTLNWRYDDNGDMTYFDQDSSGDGSPEVVRQYDYDAERNLTQIEHWQSYGATIETDTYLLTHDGKGNLTQLDRNAETFQYFYNADGKITRVENTNKFRPGVVQTTSYKYDLSGNLIRFQEGGLTGGELSTWQYSPDGNNVRYEFRSDRDDPSPELIREYETTGWGHLFFGSDIFTECLGAVLSGRNC